MECVLLGASPSSYPISKQQLSLEYLRDHTHLRWRTSTLSSIARIRSAAFHAFHAFLTSHSFVHVHAPIITPLDCEGGGETFSITAPSDGPRSLFFHSPAFLTVSGQLYSEMLASALTRVYAFGPTFRAETSVTPRHLAEFWMLEPEVSFCGLDGIMDISERMVKWVTRRIVEDCADEMELLERRGEDGRGLRERLKRAVDVQWKRLTYTDAIAALQRSGAAFDFPAVWGEDLHSEHEHWLAEVHCGGCPVFVTHYPRSLKPFYMKTDDASLNDGGKRAVVLCMDLLMPGLGELIGGSQREERYEPLQQRMLHAGLPMVQYQWYLDLRKSNRSVHSRPRTTRRSSAPLTVLLSACVL